jgi:hypothetical protein
MNLLHTSFVKITRLAPLALASLLAAGPARAAEAAPDPVPVEAFPADTFLLRTGAFLVTNIDTRLSLTTDSGGGGTIIDFGDTLGGETSATIFRVDADWYVGGPHRVQGAWYDINLKGHRVIDREIHFGDETYPINAEVDSSFRTSIYKLSYGYTFHKGRKHEFTGLIGAHVMRLSTSLTVSSLGTAEGFDVTAPLPAFGLGWTAHWTDRLQTRVVAQYFGISLDEKEISGHFLDLLFAVEYRLSRHWSVGAGYNRFDLDIEASRGPLTLQVEDSYDGFLAYFGVHF